MDGIKYPIPGRIGLMPNCYISISKEIFDKNRSGDNGENRGRKRGEDLARLLFCEQKEKWKKKKEKQRHSKQKLLQGSN